MSRRELAECLSLMGIDLNKMQSSALKGKNQSVQALRGLGFFIRRLRYKSSPYLSQRMLADNLSQTGIKLNKNAIQRIESGQRFVTDIELAAMAKTFGVTVEELMKQEE